MERIASQPYYKVERVVSGSRLETVRHERHLHLYEDRLITRYREFPIRDVFDLSYRHMGGDGGFLYVHTRQGIYPYTVSEHPAAFIEACREVIRRHSRE